METIEQILEKANKAYDKHIKEEPTFFEERGRNAYLVGRLESAYEVLCNKIKTSRI